MNPALSDSGLMLSITTYLISVSKSSRFIKNPSWTQTPFSVSFTSSWTRRCGVRFLKSTLWTITVILTPFSLEQTTGVSWAGSRLRCEGSSERRLGEKHFRSICRKPSAKSARGQAVHRQLPPETDTSRGEPRCTPSADIMPGPSLHLWEPRSDGSTESSLRGSILHLMGK